jgi:hypothetical protein
LWGTALTTYGSAGEVGVVRGGEKGWWGWEADIPLATADGRARVCSSEHSNEPLGRTVLLHQGGTGFQRVLHSPNPVPQRELWVLDHPALSPLGKLQTLTEKFARKTGYISRSPTTCYPLGSWCGSTRECIPGTILTLIMASHL